MALDLKNIDWSAFLQSRVVWGSFVTVIASVAAVAGHTIDAGQQAVLVNDLANGASGIATLAGLFTFHARVTAQPSNQTVIIPAKDPQTPKA